MDLINIIETSNIISSGTSGNIIVDKPSNSTIVVSGLPGPPGPPGGATIGSYSIVVSGIAANDLLAFNGTNWINRPQEQLTEGGNF
jgi:hypothetical protein